MINIIIDYTKKIESLLEKKFSAKGKGLHTKVSSIENKLCASIVRKIRQVATIRNKVVHDDKYVIEDITDFISECNIILDYLSYDTARLTQNNLSPEEKRNCRQVLEKMKQYMKKIKPKHGTSITNAIVLSLFESKNSYGKIGKQMSQSINSSKCYQTILDIENILGNYNLLVQKSKRSDGVKGALFTSMSIGFLILLTKLTTIINMVEKMKIKGRDLDAITENGVLKISTESLCRQQNLYAETGMFILLTQDLILTGDNQQEINLLYEHAGYGFLRKLANNDMISYPKRGKVLKFDKDSKKARIVQGEYITLNFKSFGVEPNKKNMQEIYSYLKQNIFKEYNNDKLHRFFPTFATCVDTSIYVHKLKLNGINIPCDSYKNINNC